MIILTDPGEEKFRDAIVQEGGGLISEEWMASVWEAANDWIGGSVNSSPYSYMGQTHIQLALQVKWQWDIGTLKVIVFRG